MYVCAACPADFWMLPASYSMSITPNRSVSNNTSERYRTLYVYALYIHIYIIYTYMHYIYIYALYIHICIIYTHMHYIYICIVCVLYIHILIEACVARYIHNLLNYNCSTSQKIFYCQTFRLPYGNLHQGQLTDKLIQQTKIDNDRKRLQKKRRDNKCQEFCTHTRCWPCARDRGWACIS